MVTDPSDLHARLLAHFDEGYDELRGPLIPTLRAVIELHRPQHVYPSGGSTGRPLCFGCDLGIYADDHADWPCTTINTIAEHLGVKP